MLVSQCHIVTRVGKAGLYSCSNACLCLDKPFSSLYTSLGGALQACNKQGGAYLKFIIEFMIMNEYNY